MISLVTKSVPPHNPQSHHRPETQVPFLFLLFIVMPEKKIFFPCPPVSKRRRLVQYFNVLYIHTDSFLSSPLMSWNFIIFLSEIWAVCFQISPTSALSLHSFLLYLPALNVLPRCRQMAARDVTPIFKDPDHNSFSEGLYRLYSPPPPTSRYLIALCASFDRRNER